MPMRLAILGTRGIPARYGGFETFAEQLAVRLVERGHEVTVFCEAAQGGEETYKGVTLRHLKTRNLGPLTTLFFDAESLWQARSRFDVVYMLGYGSSMFCWLPRFWNTPVWINMDGLEWKRAKWSPIARWYLHSAEAIATRIPDRIITDASAIKANLESRYLRLPTCDVIPYGCEIISNACAEELKSFGLIPGAYYLVVCRFEPENHVREIAEGFLGSSTNARLVLVGDHNGKSTYARSLLGYQSDRILFTGPIYDAPKVQALRFYCRAYLHGHSVGGTNPSLLEAMGCGNVVIAHDNPFNREVLGDSALFFSTSKMVSARVEAVDSDQAELSTMRCGAMNRAREFYSWESITNQYCNLMSLTVSKSPNRDESIPRLPLSRVRPLPSDQSK
jgi:glycosyltransferase involved in cell wall biosynthesis